MELINFMLLCSGITHLIQVYHMREMSQELIMLSKVILYKDQIRLGYEVLPPARTVEEAINHIDRISEYYNKKDMHD